MGMTPELMIGVLACAHWGVHSVVFGGFSARRSLIESMIVKQKCLLLTTGARVEISLFHLKT